MSAHPRFVQGRRLDEPAANGEAADVLAGLSVAGIAVSGPEPMPTDYSHHVTCQLKGDNELK